MRNYKKNPNLQKDFEKDLMERLCMECKSGIYMQHHMEPHRLWKCPICSHTKEIPERFIKETSVIGKPSEEKD